VAEIVVVVSVVEEATIIVVVETLKENFPHLIPLPQLILKKLNLMIKIKLFKKNCFFFQLGLIMFMTNYFMQNVFYLTKILRVYIQSLIIISIDFHLKYIS